MVSPGKWLYKLAEKSYIDAYMKSGYGQRHVELVTMSGRHPSDADQLVRTLYAWNQFRIAWQVIVRSPLGMFVITCAIWYWLTMFYLIYRNLTGDGCL